MTGLTNGTAYTFTVTATNGVGTSTSSSASNSVTPVTTPAPPQRPSGNIRRWPGDGDVEQAGGWWVNDYELYRDLVAGRSDLFDQRCRHAEL